MNEEQFRAAMRAAVMQRLEEWFEKSYIEGETYADEHIISNVEYFGRDLCHLDD